MLAKKMKVSESGNTYVLRTGSKLSLFHLALAIALFKIAQHIDLHLL